jgi:hypothetical protein
VAAVGDRKVTTIEGLATSKHGSASRFPCADTASRDKSCRPQLCSPSIATLHRSRWTRPCPACSAVVAATNRCGSE